MALLLSLSLHSLSKSDQLYQVSLVTALASLPDLQRQMSVKPLDDGFFQSRTLCATLGSLPRSLYPVTAPCGQLEEASEGTAAAVREVTDCLFCTFAKCSENRKIPSKILHFSRMQGFPGKLGHLILGSPGVFLPGAETLVLATRAILFN